jgi:hypothetical protein
MFFVGLFALAVNGLIYLTKTMPSWERGGVYLAIVAAAAVVPIKRGKAGRIVQIIVAVLIVSVASVMR